MPSMTSTIGGTQFGTPQKLPATVARLSGRLARGKGTQTKCVDALAASFALSAKHRVLAVSPDDNDTRSLHALVVAFDGVGERLLVGTAQGAVYQVDLLTFRFHLIAYTPDTITCLAPLTADTDRHVVVGQKNGHLIGINEATHEQCGQRSAHSCAVQGVCAGQAATVCSFSRSEAFVWHGAQLRKLYQLHLNSSAHIVKMVFLSDGTLLGAFADDSVYVWCLESLQVTHEVLQLSRHRASIADVAPADDCDMFYAAGKSSQVLEFSLSEMRVTRIFSLPDSSGNVKQVMVFPGPFSGQILSVLLESGAIKFIHTETGRVVQSLNHPKHKIALVSASRSGLFLACLLSSGHVCLHHSTGDVFRRIVLPQVFYDNKPRVLLVDESATRVRPPSRAPPAGTAQKAARTRGKTPMLNTARLGPIVREQGEFPAQYRRLIWRNLLELPGAHALYVTLAERGQHPAWLHVAQRFPVRDVAVSKVLSSTLSALAWWCPLFAEVEFLPYLVFPFCNVFSADPLSALETVITLLVNWCQRWFEFFPYPPISVLGLVENLLAHHCPDLLRHYMELGVTAHVYGWPLLETALSEVLTQNDWLVAWDHILCNHPSYLLAVVVAYNVVSQAALMRCKTADDISYYFRNQNVVSVRHVTRKAYVIHDSTPADIHPRDYLEAFEAIGKGAYPVFNKYPTFIVNHQLEERERISREHRAFLEERGATVQLAHEMASNRTKHKQWAEKLAYLKDAEAAHRQMLRMSEGKLAAQRRRLAELQHALRRRSRAELDSERSRSLLRQTADKEILIGRLQDEIRKKKRESDAISSQLHQEELDGPASEEEEEEEAAAAPPPTRTTSSPVSSGYRLQQPCRSPPELRAPAGTSDLDRRSQRSPPPPPPPPLVSARSSSTYGSVSPVAGSRTTLPRARPPPPPPARASPTRVTVPIASPPRGRGSPPSRAARAAAARAAARVAATRRSMVHTSLPRGGSPRAGPTRGGSPRAGPTRGGSPRAGSTRGGSPRGGSSVRGGSGHDDPTGGSPTRGGPAGGSPTRGGPAGGPRRSRLQPDSPRGGQSAVTRRVRMVPGTVDADIGALEREIDEIAADVASMARISAAPDHRKEQETYCSAGSFSTWNSRSAPDVASLVDAHSSAQQVREKLVRKWRDEDRSSDTSRSLRTSRSQLQQTAADHRRRSAGSRKRTRQTVAPRRQISFRSMF